VPRYSPLFKPESAEDQPGGLAAYHAYSDTTPASGASGAASGKRGRDRSHLGYTGTAAAVPSSYAPSINSTFGAAANGNPSAGAGSSSNGNRGLSAADGFVDSLGQLSAPATNEQGLRYARQARYQPTPANPTASAAPPDAGASAVGGGYGRGLGYGTSTAASTSGGQAYGGPASHGGSNRFSRLASFGMGMTGQQPAAEATTAGSSGGYGLGSFGKRG